jgi:23S rRNA pseudouridine1911/1915/1917 synthase
MSLQEYSRIMHSETGEEGSNDTVSVLFEDEAVLVLNKPAGIAVHEDGHTRAITLCDWVRHKRPLLIGVGEPMRLQNGTVIDRPGVVHRLDRATSGVIVLAKTQPAFEALKAQFKDRMIEKHYRALVWGTVREPHGTIDKPIGRSRKDFRLWSAGPDAGGKLRSAVTRYSLLATRDNFSYLDLEPKTGRTHQIRVHLKSIGHPIVCDDRYASGKPAALGLTRLALHAHSLAFTHPNGSHLIVEAPLPLDLEAALKQLTR